MPKSLRKMANEAYKQTDVAKLDALIKSIAKWERRATIARNKLSVINGELREVAEEIAMRSMQKDVTIAEFERQKGGAG